MALTLHWPDYPDHTHIRPLVSWKPDSQDTTNGQRACGIENGEQERILFASLAKQISQSEISCLPASWLTLTRQGGSLEKGQRVQSSDLAGTGGPPSALLCPFSLNKETESSVGMHLQSQYSKASQFGSHTGLHSDTLQRKKERDGEERERSAGLTGMVERFLPFSYRTLAAKKKNSLLW